AAFLRGGQGAASGPASPVYYSGAAVQFFGGAGDPGFADVHVFAWTVTTPPAVPAIAGGTGPVFGFTPAVAGTYTVGLTTVDEDAASGSAGKSLSVRDRIITLVPPAP